MPDSTSPVTLPEGEALDRLLFGRILGHAASLGAPLAETLGMDAAALEALTHRHAPQVKGLLAANADVVGEAAPPEDAIEEDDLRQFILDHRGHDGPEAEWLAAIVARRTLANNHLWQDMGFANRAELSAMFLRHFPALKAANNQDMKWKKFFYRSLCEREGFALCKSPNCEVCEDFTECFGDEPGDPLSTLAHLTRPKGE